MALRFITLSLLLLASVSSVTGQRVGATAIAREDASSSSNQQGEHAVDPSSQRRELTGFWSLFFLRKYRMSIFCGYFVAKVMVVFFNGSYVSYRSVSHTLACLCNVQSALVLATMSAAAPRASWETRADTARESLIPVNAKVTAAITAAATPTATPTAIVATTRRVPASLVTTVATAAAVAVTVPVPTRRATISRKEPPC
jgi:hypothetical protein